MVEYTEQAVLVDELRACDATNTCNSVTCRRFYECTRFQPPHHMPICAEAADMIEALFKQVEEREALIDELKEEVAYWERKYEEGAGGDMYDEIAREEKCGL